MKKILFFIFASIVGFFLLPKSALAVSYPIQALGNCRDAQECRYFCDIPENSPICWSYGTYILHGNVLGETTTSPDEQVKTNGITFPIPELGNCANATACMQYCDQQQNHDACTAFGKMKGLTHESEQTKINTGRILQDAKTVLGCNSMDACRIFCSSPDNKQKCMAFAQSEGIAPKISSSITPTPLPVNLFEITKSLLNCDSLTTCKEVCSKQENYQKCTSFATAHNLTTPHPSKKPQMMDQNEHEGTSSSTFQLYQKQKPFLTPPSDKAALMQKIGCTTTQECAQYCKEHTGVCPGFPYASTSGTFKLQPYPLPSISTHPMPYTTPYPQSSSTQNFPGNTSSAEHNPPQPIGNQ